MIILPRNGFGATIMLLVIALVGTIPFTITLWLSLKVAPWWVAIPLACAASLVTLLCTVKLKAR